jgi:hypothetical protein
MTQHAMAKYILPASSYKSNASVGNIDIYASNCSGRNFGLSRVRIQ